MLSARCQLDTEAYINEIMSVYLKHSSDSAEGETSIHFQQYFNYIISWRSDLLVEETGENHIPATPADRHL